MNGSESNPAGCALCGAQATLKQSHIIPRFVSRGLKIPDTPTRPLLCGECEDLFSGYESTFARIIFHPLVADGRVVAKYDKWLLKFAVSVCWRILEAGIVANRFGGIESHGAAQLASCRETWRQFLRGNQTGVGVHHLHLLSGDLVAEAGGIEIDAPRSDRESFVYAKLGPIILLGLIADPDPEQWQGTRIHLEGKIKPRVTFVPAHYREHITTRLRLPAMS